VGAFLGLLFGLGVALLWTAARPQQPRPGRRGPRDRVEEMLAQAGVEAVTPAALAASCAGLGGLGFLAVAALTRSS
jgi:tight adherence protein B